MRSKENVDLLINAGIQKPEFRKDAVYRNVNRLIEALFIPNDKGRYQTDPLRLKRFGIENEPINWGSISANEVLETKDGVFIVVIDEAMPGQCTSFCEYLVKYMALNGWDIEVRTEW
jgi:hypothetical protein